MAKELYITIDKSKSWHNTKKLWDYVKDLEDGKYKITVSKADKRSLQQNNYYWEIIDEYVQPLLYEMGWEHVKNKEAAHQFMCETFLKISDVNIQTGEMKVRVRSTTELSKMEFNIYLEDIWRWASEFGVVIPSPNEQLTIVK